MFTQPFLVWGDDHYYALVPGQSADNFDGSGWALTSGARIIMAQLADGHVGQVLELPRGARAVSPTFCVSSDYTTARAMMREVVGHPNVSFYVIYATGVTPTTGVRRTPATWTLSPPLKLFPSKSSGWQLAKFVFVAGQNPSDVQLYDFYVDPYSKG